MNFTIKVNGQSHTVDVDPATPLLYVLSDDLALRGPKFGCGLGQCGCCTVLVRGATLSGSPPAAVRSCVTPIQTMNGAEITTLEGLGTIEKPHPIQKAFIDEQAMQCGFCLSGVMLTAKVALDRNPKATDAQLQQALSNVLCRCGAHTRMMKAIRKYQQEVGA
jgi:nicotinate dehydrogenase subunit A